MSPHIIRQVTKELLDLQKNPPEGIKVFMNEEDVTDVQAAIEGPGNVFVVVITDQLCDFYVDTQHSRCRCDSVNFGLCKFNFVLSVTAMQTYV